MNRTSTIQSDIVAHLKRTGQPETSRALASRFLRIESGDEEVCRRLLAPFLADLPGVVHRSGVGWSLGKGAPGAAAPRDRGAVPDPVPEPRRPAQELRTFVALASEGTGPGGSGALAAATLLPVVDGEECQEEHFPDRPPEEDDLPSGDGAAGGLAPFQLQDLLQTIGDLPVVCHRISREVEPLRRLCALSGLSFNAPVLSAAKLGHLLLGLKSNHAAADLAHALGVDTRGPDDRGGRARLVASSFLRLAALLEERGVDTVDAVLEYQDMPAPPLDLSAYAFTADDLKALPAGPGVYRFIDRDDRIIYVGKAKNLRARVGSYFIPSAGGTAKGRAILDAVFRLEFDSVASELEANLLESALIAEHRPALNRQFDVHERPAPYGPRLNLVVVLRDGGPAAAGSPTSTLHILCGGRYVRRIGGLPSPGAAPDGSWQEVPALLSRLYFPSATEGPGGVGGRNEGADIDWQLVSSFVRKYRDQVNVLDLDECASALDAERRLRVLVEATNAGPGRVVAR